MQADSPKTATRLARGVTRATRYLGDAGSIVGTMARYAVKGRRRGVENGFAALAALARELGAVARGGTGERTCPICGWAGPEFAPMYYVDQFRRGVRCWSCGSTDRDRLMHIWVPERLGPFFAERRRRVLDIGPLRYSRGFFPAGVDYVSFDLASPHAMVHGDLCHAPFADASFDVWLCFHVLDLIEDDTRAMRELFRITRPGGLGLLDNVMNWDGPTEQYDSARPEECNHLRRYGTDLVDRLEAVGFAVEIVDVDEAIDAAVRRRHGIHGRKFLVCRRSE